jgi:hypothetical protein
MTTSFFSFFILAIALPSLRIFSLNRAWLVAMGILSIVLFHTASDNLVYSVNWIGMDIFSGLFIFSSVNPPKAGSSIFLYGLFNKLNNPTEKFLSSS